MKRLIAIILLFAAWPALAADLNGYTAKYECIAGGANCNVNMVAYTSASCQQTISTSTTPTGNWSAINWTNDVICIQAGDHSARGRLDIDGWQGTSGSYKVLRCVTGGSICSDPWTVAIGSRAKVKAIGFDVSSRYIILDRITADGDGYSSYAGIEVFINGDVNNIIINRSLVEDYNNKGIFVSYPNNTDIMIQNSVVRSMRLPTADLQENDCIHNHGANNFRVVNNEIYDCNKLTFFDENTFTGAVVENNDGYYSGAYRYNCSGVQSNTGNCSGGEGICWDTKGGATSASPHLVIQNRCWSMKPGDVNVPYVQSGGGWCISFSAIDDTTGGTDYYLIQNNICIDADLGLWNYWDGDGVTRNSVVGNILWQVYNHGGQPVGSDDRGGLRWRNLQTSEFYLNTIIDATPSILNTGGGSNNDLRCNVFIASGADEFVAETGTVLDYNVYYGTVPISPGDTTKLGNYTLNTRQNSTAYALNDIIRTTATPPADGTAGDFLYRVTVAGTSASSPPSYPTTLGNTVSDGTMTVRAIRGPHTFKRKLRTISGGETAVIPYAKAHTSAPEEKFCPSTYAGRAGIGIGDE